MIATVLALWCVASIPVALVAARFMRPGPLNARDGTWIASHSTGDNL